MEPGSERPPGPEPSPEPEPEPVPELAMMYEYAVDMVCDMCAQAVHRALAGQAGVTTVTTNVRAQIAVVEGSMAPGRVVELLEAAGRKVKLIGSGSSTAVEKGVFVVPAAVGPSGENSAAVSEFKGAATGHGAVVGVVRFVGLAAGPEGSAEAGPWAHVDVTVHGLAADSEYTVELHEYGDLSRGAASTGELWGWGVVGGGPRRTSADGRLEMGAVLSGHHLWECIGRATVLRLQLPPDTPPPADAMACTPVLRPGLTAEAPELVGGGAVAAVVARSAGVGANHKMLCACDGTVIWDAEALMPGGTGRAKPVAKQNPGA